MTDRRLFDFTLWLLAGICLLVLVASCSPLAAYEPTPATTATAVVYSSLEQTTTPLPYWMLATARPPRLNIQPVTTGGRVGY